jgi:hypothetical protein
MDITCVNNHSSKGVIDGVFVSSYIYSGNCLECNEVIRVHGAVGMEAGEIPDNHIILSCESNT